MLIPGCVFKRKAQKPLLDNRTIQENTAACQHEPAAKKKKLLIPAAGSIRKGHCGKEPLAQFYFKRPINFRFWIANTDEIHYPSLCPRALCVLLPQYT